MTTVIRRPCRWRAACSVVVPMSIITVWPSSTSAAAAAPIRSFASNRSTADSSNGGSPPAPHRAAADPLDHPRAGELAQVAPDGHLRHAERLRQIADVGRPGTDGAQDLLAPPCGDQRSGHRSGTSSAWTSSSSVSNETRAEPPCRSFA